MSARRLLPGLSLSLLCLAAAPPALALANRVFVSARSGNDANSCDSITTPCQTFAGAVLQLNPGGEAIVLDSGGYGPVTITKSLTIEAPPGVLGFIHPPGGSAITVNAGASDKIVLRGLVLNGGPGSGDGITVNTVGALHIESCVISGFVRGVYFLASGSLFVSDTMLRGNGAEGIRVSPASGLAQASIDHCRFERNVYGVMSNGFDASSFVTVRDCVAAGNSDSGFNAYNGELNIENCVAANNFIGISSRNFGVVRVSNTTVTDNGTGLEASSTLVSRSNNTVRGNTPNGSFTGTFAAD